MHMKMSFKKPLGRSQRLVSNVNVVEAQPPPLWTHRRVRAVATYVTGRRRIVQMPAMRGSFPGQGPYGLGSGASGMRPMQRPRTLQQLVDILSGGDADDPEQFLQLLSLVPRLLGPQRVLSPPSKSRDPIVGTASERYARLKQLQQLRLQQRKALGDSSRFDAQRWAQREKEEEQRCDVLREAMLQNARRHLLQYDTPSLARLASGLAIAGIQDPALCDEMLLQVIKQQQYLQEQQQQQKRSQQLQQLQALFDPQSLAELLDAFAAMRHRPTDAQLAEVLRLQQQEQQAVEQSRLRQAQAQQVIGSQPRLELRIMGMPPEAKLPPPQQQPGPGYAASRGGSTSMSPEDAARLLYALSRLGYIPDEGTLTQLLEQLQPHRLQLQPAVPHLNGQASKVRRSPARRELAGDQQGQMQESRPQEELMRWAAVQVKPEAQVRPQPKPERPLELRQQSSEEPASEEYDEQKNVELEDKLSYSLQRDAQAVVSAVRALQRMGRPAKAQQLRESFTRYVRDMQAQVMQENEEEEEEEAEREGMAGAEAAAAAMLALRKKEEQLLQEAAEVKRRQRKEEQVRALRQQLLKKLQSADQWQQIRALLFTYQEALDAECLVAAASQLGELLAALRRTNRGLAMTLRERGDLGDLLEGLGQLVLRQLDGSTSAQVSSLFCSMVRLRHLEEGLLVGLLRRLRDVLEDARPGELAAVLGALADCGVRPSKHWMEAFLRRCEALLEQFSPGELAALPVSLVQLGVHPGSSWLGAYLDSLQTREGELSQSAVSEAVRAVALIDRPFLSAWRQAAAVREQQRHQARTAAADAVAAVAKQQPAEEPLWHMQQRELEQPYPSALASVEDMLAELGVRQDPPIEAGQENFFPPMHPKQRSMLEQQPESTSSIVFTQQEHPAERPQAVAHAQAATDTDPQVKSASYMSENVPTSHSVELDVESADLSYSGGVPASAAGSSPSSELAAVANSPAGASAFSAGRQLPGSFSIDGYYNLDPYGEYEEQDDKWNEDTGEGEYVDGGVEVVTEEMEEDHVDQLAQNVGCASEDEEDLQQSSTLAASPAAVVTHANSEGVDMEPTVHGGAGVDSADGALPGITLASSATASPQLGDQGHPGAQDVPVRMHVHECGDQAQQQQQQERPDHGAQARNKGTLQEVQQEEQQEATSLEQRKQIAWQGESLDGQGEINMQQLGMEEAQEAPPKHPKQPTAEELSQARALRSLLLERYEAVAAYRNELEEQERREAEAEAEGRGNGKFSKREVAAAANVLAAREQLQRLQADYDNFKRRASEERQQALARAKADVLRPILAVADNFERAATQIKPKADGERVLHETYQSVYAKLEEFLEMAGMQEVGVQGEAFDPNLHEAVMREDRDDVEDGTVTCVFQKGYRLGDLLVRPALVKVAYS